MRSSFLRTRKIWVPDHPEALGGLEGSDEKRRRALPAIEMSLGDRDAWDLYCVPDNLYIAWKVYGKRMKVRKRK